MDYKLVFTKSAERDLRVLDFHVAKRILKKLKSFIETDDPLSFAKKLKGFEFDTFRFRIGDYRVVFRLDEKTGRLVLLVVLKVKHRKDVYRES